MKNLSDKQIFFIALAVALLLTGWLLWQSWQTQLISRTIPAIPTQAQATLSLEPREATVKVGQTFGVGIRVEVKNGEATGVEAILAYDPEYLEVLDGDKEEIGIQAVEIGFFDEYLGNKVDSEEGKITVSGINMSGERFSQGTIGTILFKAKKQGETEVEFIFAPGEKDESDVAAPGGNDILEVTIDGKFNIQ